MTRANGQPLANDARPASLLLLMGRNGPAFLAYDNFNVYTEWNKSLNYATTAAYLGTRIDGAPPLSPGRAPVQVLDQNAIKELQTLLAKRGADVGTIDGRLGTATRGAIRQAQLKLGLPARFLSEHRAAGAAARRAPAGIVMTALCRARYPRGISASECCVECRRSGRSATSGPRSRMGTAV